MLVNAQSDAANITAAMASVVPKTSQKLSCAAPLTPMNAKLSGR